MTSKGRSTTWASARALPPRSGSSSRPSSFRSGRARWKATPGRSGRRWPARASSGCPGPPAAGTTRRTCPGSRCVWSGSWRSATTTCKARASGMPRTSFAGVRTGRQSRAPTPSSRRWFPPSSRRCSEGEPMHLLLSLLLLASPADAGSASSPAPRPLTFDYDARQPLDLKDEVISETSELALHDVSYASANQQRVSAYLIVPKGKGPFAPIVFGHWGNGNRAEFIPEAKLYARAGAISLLPDYPWDRREPYRRSTGHFDKPELDRDAFAQAVIDLRRGIDLLLARKDVDAKRVAYVGHSYGAQWGAILAAVDRRMRTAVLMAGVGETGDIFLKNPDPEFAELRKQLPPA